MLTILDEDGDEVVYYYLTRRVSMKPRRCSVTGNRIPMFSIAFKRRTTYFDKDGIHREITWVSPAGKTFLALTENE